MNPETTEAINRLIPQVSFHDGGAAVRFGKLVIALDNKQRLLAVALDNGGDKILMSRPGDDARLDRSVSVKQK